MKEYRQNFTKTVRGYVSVKAKNIEEAKEKIADGDFYDEFDNKSNVEYTSEVHEEKGVIRK